LDYFNNSRRSLHCERTNETLVKSSNHGRKSTQKTHHRPSEDYKRGYGLKIRDGPLRGRVARIDGPRAIHGCDGELEQEITTESARGHRWCLARCWSLYTAFGVMGRSASRSNEEAETIIEGGDQRIQYAVPRTTDEMESPTAIRSYHRVTASNQYKPELTHQFRQWRTRRNGPYGSGKTGY